MKVVIVDYGMGNIFSIFGALKYLGIDNVELSNSTKDLKSADKLILPGVGNFYSAVSKITELGLGRKLNNLVINEKKPILGICLGMQLLGISSTENGFNTGLNFVPGEVKKFSDSNLKIPHVGYNQVRPNTNSRLFNGIREKTDFYFTHSYMMQSEKDIGESLCTYGRDFIASFEVENVAGVQFHPELSQRNGLLLLKNFIELF